jgi:hypothetical protein
MKLSKLFVLSIFSAFVFFAEQTVQAGPGHSLTESVKADLMAAQPVLGKKVGQETFDGKPILVTFFASW